jgi:hypothetical protein
MINLNVNQQRVIIKPDNPQTIITGYSYYTFTGITPTVVHTSSVGNHITISISTPSGATGPQGPQGVSGATGPQGPSGNTGPQGPQGISGATGPQGPQGPSGNTGPQGPQGISGNTGPQGPQGISGNTGPQGPSGNTGPQGPQGVSGATGPQGPQGVSGATGPQGPQGVSGATGPQGPQGISGITPTLSFLGSGSTIVNFGQTGTTYQINIFSPSGATGPQGPQGISGATGPQGPSGNTGPQGPQGISGATGPQGPQGISGATGPQGPQGISGATGPQGPQGISGATGPQGISGATGPQGPSGITPTLVFTGSSIVNYYLSGQTYYINVSGQTGAQGPQGISGATGPQGPQGISGATGPQGPQGISGATGPQGISGNTGPQGPQGISGATGPQGISGNTVINYYTFIPSGGTIFDIDTGNTVTIYSPPAVDISGKLNISTFSGYTGTTVPNTYETKINFNLFTGTTVPNTYYNKTEINSYTGETSNETTYLQTQIDNLGAIKSQAQIFIFEHPFSNIPGYEQLNPVATTLTGATETVTTAGTALIDSYVTPSTGLGVTGITSGIWTYHFHAHTNIANNSGIRFDIYTRRGIGETLHFQSEVIPITTTTTQEYQVSETQATISGLLSTDRLVVKVYAVNTASRTITWQYTAANFNAYIQLPIFAETAPQWSNIASKPSWISGLTLASFETGHTHSQYETIANVNHYTGTTAPNTYQTIANVSHYTGTTVPATYATILGNIATFTGTTKTITNTESGKILKFTNTAARTVTLPTGLTTNLQITAINYGGTTALSFVAGTGVTIHSKNSALKLATIYGAATAIFEGPSTGAAVWTIFGDLTL